MTEKIVRRGVKTPDIFEPDMLNSKLVEDVMKNDAIVLSEENTIREVRDWFDHEDVVKANYFIVVDDSHNFKGIISSSTLFNNQHDTENLIGSLIKRRNISVYINSSLKTAVEKMAKENIDVLPIVSKENKIIGVVSYKDIIAAYGEASDEHEKKRPHISLRKQGLKILVRGQRLMNFVKEK